MTINFETRNGKTLATLEADAVPREGETVFLLDGDDEQHFQVHRVDWFITSGRHIRATVVLR